MRTADTGALDVTTEATNTGWLPRQDKLENYHSETATNGQTLREPLLEVPSTRVECTDVHRLLEK